MNIKSLINIATMVTSLIGMASAEDLQTKDDFVVKDLPGLSDLPVEKRPIMHAGQLEISDKNNTNLFFWKFAKPETNTTLAQSRDDRLVIWLNGGPGCSSMDGALMEIGPFRIDQDYKVTLNEGSWMQVSDLLFVDQPGGTGFSYTEVYDRELYQAAAHFLTFLKNYFKVFPNDAKKQIWIAGESYAGQYIPHFADFILKENAKDNDFYVDLKGLLIGNGWIEPDIQSLSYVPFFMENNLIDKEHEQFSRVLRSHENCQKAIFNTDDHSFEKAACNKVMDVLLSVLMEREGEKRTCLNMYDYRKTDSYPACGANWPEDLVEVTPFLNLPEVQKAINLKQPKRWRECDHSVSRFFEPSSSKKSFEILPSLLRELQIMLFSGDKDIICNYLGTENLIERLEIAENQLGFSNDTGLLDWYYDDARVGEVRAEHNLTYVKIFDSSHMVPYDLPEISRGLLDLMMSDASNLGTKYVTPVYNYDTDDYYYSKTDGTTKSQEPTNESDDDKSSDSKHGVSFYFLEFIVIVILAGVFFYCYKSYTGSSSKSSFLSSTAGSRKKKRVHWFDDSEEEDSQNMDLNDLNDLGNNTNNNKSGSVLGSVLNRLGYSNNNSNYVPVDGDRQRDIELGAVEDQFIMESDDEEYIGGNSSAQQQNSEHRRIGEEEDDTIFSRGN